MNGLYGVMNKMIKFDKISECGKYGFVMYYDGPGGQLWAWIDHNPTNVGDVWDIENFDIAIEEHELEMGFLVRDYQECVKRYGE